MGALISTSAESGIERQTNSALYPFRGEMMRHGAAPAPGAGLPTGTARTRSLASASKDLGRQSALARWDTNAVVSRGLLSCHIM